MSCISVNNEERSAFPWFRGPASPGAARMRRDMRCTKSNRPNDRLGPPRTRFKRGERRQLN
eukprot:1413843-Prymnesium_polylepis.1